MKLFVYIWEYVVKEGHQTEFKGIYRADGDWARLFRKARGYIATDLHQDLSDPGRFVTVDFWRTKDDYDRFRETFAEEYKDLDDLCGNHTERENLIGFFESDSVRFVHLTKIC